MTKRRQTRPTPRNNSSRRPAPSSRPSARAWVIAIVLIGIFVAGIAYLNHYRNYNQASPIHRLLNHKSESKATIQSPEFEFYTALPSGKLALMPTGASSSSTETVTPSKSEPKPAAPTTSVKTTTPTTSAVLSAKTAIPVTQKAATDYFLQVAAFQHYPDADKLKAQLLLDDFNANVTSYKVNNTEWFRVIVGPFTDLAKLSQAQAKLSALHYQPMPLVLKK